MLSIKESLSGALWRRGGRLASAAFLSLLLVGCHHYEWDYCCYRWRYEEAQSCYPCQNSARAYLKPETPCGTLQLELVRDHCGCRMYLSTHCHVFCDSCCDRQVAVQVETSGDKMLFDAVPFQGGQRLLLSDEAFEAITTALWCDDCVTIRIGMHKAALTSACFKDVYRRIARFGNL